jgi:putative restriction endonuclease
MSELSVALSRVRGEHGVALRWFHGHAGQRIAWARIKDLNENGARLVNQAKGIYKPHYTDYALSVRQTLNGPYADKEVYHRPDGSWVYSYFQENPNPAQRDQEATNRGLMQCMADGVPIGVLLQVKPKPGVEYDVLGLAVVSEWRDGYFILEGFSRDGNITANQFDPDAAHDRARAETSPIEDFDPRGVTDARQRQLTQVVRRRGQARFRAALLQAYGRKCAITGCDGADALEAAHISPYRGGDTNRVQNGLLLRADLHTLFDLGLLAVDPTTTKVILASSLRETSYAEFDGRRLAVPSDPALAPNAEALRQHLAWSRIREG